MRSDTIARIEIDADGRLHVVPSTATFPYVWREAMEVNWDPERRSLYAPPPREWSRRRWFRHVLDAAHAQGVTLHLSEETEWVGVAADVKAALLQAGGL